MAKKLGPVGVAIGSIAGVALSARSAMSALARSFSEVDEAAKVAARLNLTIASLEALKLAAVEGGSAGNTLVMALQRMTRRISEAAQGAGEAKDALRELGLSAESLSRLTADQQLVAVAEAMQGVSNAGDKTRLMMRLFDSEGVALTNTLESLAKTGMEPLRKEIRELGALSAADAAGIERMNDQWVELKTAMQGVVNQVAASIAPVLADLLEHVIIPLTKGLITMAKVWRELFGADASAMAGRGEEAALAAKTAATETSKWAAEQKRLKEEAAALARIEKEATKERAKKLAHAKAELSALDRIKATVKSTPTPTLGAIGRGTSGAVSAIQSLVLAGRDRAADEADERRRIIELAVKRERWLAEIARLTRVVAAKPEVRVATHSVF